MDVFVRTIIAASVDDARMMLASELDDAQIATAFQWLMLRGDVAKVALFGEVGRWPDVATIAAAVQRIADRPSIDASHLAMLGLLAEADRLVSGDVRRSAVTHPAVDKMLKAAGTPNPRWGLGNLPFELMERITGRLAYGDVAALRSVSHAFRDTLSDTNTYHWIPIAQKNPETAAALLHRMPWVYVPLLRTIVGTDLEAMLSVFQCVVRRKLSEGGTAVLTYTVEAARAQEALEPTLALLALIARTTREGLDYIPQIQTVAAGLPPAVRPMAQRFRDTVSNVMASPNTLFDALVTEGHVWLVRAMLRMPYNLHTSIALSIAAANGHIAVVDELLRHQLPYLHKDSSLFDSRRSATFREIQARQDALCLALTQAAIHGRLAVAIALVNAHVGNTSAFVNMDNGAALRWAAFHGNLHVAAYLLAVGAEVYVVEHQALANAASGGHTDMVRLLLDHGANPCASDGAAVARAASHGHLETLRVLVQAGANGAHPSALCIAVVNGHLETARALMDEFGAPTTALFELFESSRGERRHLAEMFMSLGIPVPNCT